jgi:hypothetical protein
MRHVLSEMIAIHEVWWLILSVIEVIIVTTCGRDDA